MPIKVTCTCGQAFAAQDQLAGKAVKCPKCGQGIRVPAAPAPAPAAAPAPSAGLASLLDEAGVKAHAADNRRRCPNCDTPMMDVAVICIACGFNSQTNSFIKGHHTRNVDAERYAALLGGHVDGGQGAAAVAVLKKAETAISDDKRELKAAYRQGAPVWMLVVALSFIATLSVSISLFPMKTAVHWSGMVLAISSGAVALVFSIRICVTAFADSMKEGLLTLIPPYTLYYVATHWRSCGRFFLICLIGIALGLGGIGMMMWAEGMKDEQPGGGEKALAPPRPAAAVLAVDLPTPVDQGLRKKPSGWSV